jgi:sugar lactone lactonase YvrE
MEELASGYSLLEGPTVDGEGSVYFSDVIQGGVYRWSPGGIVQVVPKRRGVGGIVVHADGGLIVTGRDVQHVRDGEAHVLLALDGVSGFNDLATAPDGSVYVGALRFHPFKGESPVPGEIWRIAPEGEAAPVAGGVLWANGIGFSPDGRVAYGSDYARSCVLAWDVGDDGSLSAPRTFAEMPGASADGLAVDEEGGVWVAPGAAGNLVRFAPDGSLDRAIDVPASFVSSLCFGGDEMRDLYVTTGDGKLLRGRSDVAGLVLAPAAIQPHP